MVGRDPFLVTERLALSIWRPDDVGLATALWEDPDVTRFIRPPGSAPTPGAGAARLAQEIELQARHRVQYWPAFLRAGGDHVGCCGLRPYRDQPLTFELGVHLLPAFWRQGLAREAARAVIAYGFDELGAAALFAGHSPDNLGSRALLASLGFRYTHDELYPPTGRMHPSHLLERDQAVCAGGARARE